MNLFYILLLTVSAVILFLIGGYLFLIMPRLRKADAAPIKDLLFAHRGFHEESAGRPQNTLAAFAKAVEYGYGMELDVHITKDKQLAVIHDHHLGALCSHDGIVEEMTLAELKELRVLGSDQQIPAFREVLELVGGRTPLLVEIKGGDNGEELCPLLMAELDNYKGLYCIESFNPLHLRWLKKHRPEVLRGQLSCPMGWRNKRTLREKAKAFAAEMLLDNVLSRPDFIAYDFKYSHKLSVRLCKQFGAYMAGWTIRTPEEYAKTNKFFPVQIFENFHPDNEIKH